MASNSGIAVFAMQNLRNKMGDIEVNAENIMTIAEMTSGDQHAICSEL